MIRIVACSFCEMTTAGEHRRHCPNHPDNQISIAPAGGGSPITSGGRNAIGSYGWQCPVCGQVNAPWVSVCTGYHSLTDSINKITISAEMWQKWGTS